MVIVVVVVVFVVVVIVEVVIVVCSCTFCKKVGCWCFCWCRCSLWSRLFIFSSSLDDNLDKLHKFNDWRVEVARTNKWLDGLQETIETAEKPTEDPQVREKQADKLKVGCTSPFKLNWFPYDRSSNLFVSMYSLYISFACHTVNTTKVFGFHVPISSQAIYEEYRQKGWEL